MCPTLKYLAAVIGVLFIGGATLIGAHNVRGTLPWPDGQEDEGPMPDLNGAIGWINSPPLGRDALRGKVVLIDFWTYTCINSLRPLPYVQAWAATYRAEGLVVIGVHSPEFSFEKDLGNVQNATTDLKLAYPVAIDSNYKIWNAFKNDYWPAQYLVDGTGQIRYHHRGEGDYVGLERRIQKLLTENGASKIGGSTVKVSGEGIEAPPSDDEQSPESYLGYLKSERFASNEPMAKDQPTTYDAPTNLALNQWALSGSWNVGDESAALQATPGKVFFRFHSRDLHLVLAPATTGTPVRFKVILDGQAPGDSHGVDVSPDGSGQVREPRLYQLIRQSGPIEDRTFEIEFLDPGVRALDFTFG